MRKWFNRIGLGWLLWRMFGPEMPPRTDGPQTIPLRLGGSTVIVGRHEYLVRDTGGDKPVIVLLHGWVYGSIATWHAVVPKLTDEFRVVAVDLRNHGKTDRRRGRFEISDLADDVAAVLDAAEIRPAAVVGYSMGGMVAMELARRHPRLVARLVLMATAAKPVDRSLARVGFLAARAAARLDPVTSNRVVHAYLLRTGAIEREHSAWLWEVLMDRDIDLYYEAGFAILRFDARDWIGKITVPSLVVIPTKDQLIPSRGQYETAALMGGPVEVAELVGARHEAVFTHSDRIAKEISGFVAR